MPCCARLAGVLILAASAVRCAGTAELPAGPSPVLTVGPSTQTGRPAPPPPPLFPVQALGATKFLAFGDSITCGVPGAFPTMDLAFDDPNCVLTAGAPQFPQLARGLLQAASPSQTIVVDNEGRPGEEVASAYSRFSALMAARRPQGVLLLEGINDLNSGRSVSATVEAMVRMIELARLYNTTVLVGTMFQTCYSENPFTGRVRTNSTSLIVPYNTALRAAVAGRLNVYVVDLYASFGNGNCLATQGTNYVGDDGLHPSPSGYSRIASTFAQAVRDRFAVGGTFQ